MDMITAEEVIRRIESYFTGGAASYLTDTQVETVRAAAARDWAAVFPQMPAAVPNGRLPGLLAGRRRPPTGCRMLAVTIGVGEKWAALAHLAAESCRRMTGLETRILDGEAMRQAEVEKPHHLKFRLFDLLPEATDILYFDADMIFLKRWNPMELAGLKEWVAVADRAELGCVQADAAQIGVPRSEYFNSGLFIVNRRHHHRVLTKATHYLGQFVSPFYDQTALNVARHRARMPLALLPRVFNWLDFDRARAPEGLMVGHFWPIDTLEPSAAEAHFRHWQARLEASAGGVERVAGLVSVISKKTHSLLTAEESRSHQDFVAVAKAGFPFPKKRFAGRGIVICGGGAKYFPCAWVCIRRLRALGCTLPIALWHLGAPELPGGAADLLEHSDFYYRYIHGDKETFHLAWRKLGQDYAMPRALHALPGTMCQHDFAGRRVFQHRNFAKWQLHAANRRIPGFRHEAECAWRCSRNSASAGPACHPACGAGSRQAALRASAPPPRRSVPGRGAIAG